MEINLRCVSCFKATSLERKFQTDPNQNFVAVTKNVNIFQITSIGSFLYLNVTEIWLNFFHFSSLRSPVTPPVSLCPATEVVDHRDNRFSRRLFIRKKMKFF